MRLNEECIFLSLIAVQEVDLFGAEFFIAREVNVLSIDFDDGFTRSLVFNVYGEREILAVRLEHMIRADSVYLLKFILI